MHLGIRHNELHQVFGSSARFFLLVSVPVILGVLIWHYLDRQFERQQWAANEQRVVDSAATIFNNYFYEVLGDLLILASNDNLYRNTPLSNQRLASEFNRYASIRRSYYQLRFIDTHGMEVVRVNYADGILSQTPVPQLQNKLHRPYFSRSISLSRAEIYISQLDLNVEHGDIETPHRPVIRFATPVYDPDGVKQGILIINYLGEKLLRQIKELDNSNPGRLMLLNADGYWLHSDHPEDSWGFQLSHRRNIQQEFPGWARITASTSGQVEAQGALITFRKTGSHSDNELNWLKTYTPASSATLVTDDPYWTIASVVSEKKLLAAPMHRLHNTLIGLFFLLIPLALLSLLWGRRASQSLMDQKRIRTYASIIEQSNEHIYITDPQGHALYINPAFERDTGYRTEEITGLTPTNLKPETYPPGLYRKLWDTINSGDSFSTLLINQKKDGTPYHEFITINPLFDSRGNIEHFVLTGRNLSDTNERKQHEMIIASRLSGGIAHHLNNLLAGIKGYIQLTINLLENTPQTDAIQLLEKSLASSERAEKLISKIAALSHEKLINQPDIRLDLLLQETVASIGENPDNKCQLNLHVGEPGLTVPGHYGMLMTAAQAAIENACEASAANGEITIYLGRETLQHEDCATCGEPLQGEFMGIAISDNGPGIPPSIQRNIFDPFYTTRESGKLVGQTPGLGLTMIRSIVHAHGGHLRLSSESGSGTTLYLLFPAS